MSGQQQDGGAGEEGGAKVYEKGAVPVAIGVNTLRAIDIMRGAEVGDTLTWDRFVGALETDLEGVRRTVLSARRILERDGVLFETVIGIGIQRISDDEAVEREVHRKLNGVRRRARSLGRYCSVLNIDGLSSVNKIRAIGAAQVARLTEKATERRTVDKLGTSSGMDENGTIPTLAASFQRLAELQKDKEKG